MGRQAAPPSGGSLKHTEHDFSLTHTDHEFEYDIFLTHTDHDIVLLQRI